MGWPHVACRRMPHKENHDRKTEQKKPLGRPCQKWFDTTKRDMTRINATLNINMALNREQWRGVIEVIKDLNGLF